MTTSAILFLTSVIAVVLAGLGGGLVARGQRGRPTVAGPGGRGAASGAEDGGR
ncbi:hypothetical protein [Amycolatopsis tolypomycina]|uniref:hypothetical protein n=1 Tax=Amycolatopsis tolypomycina TaxID=208445 RepID=UPI0033B23650